MSQPSVWADTATHSDGRAEGSSTPLDVSACSATALRKATQRVSQHYDRVLALSGLRSTQRSLMAHVAWLGSPSVSALAAALVIDRGALTHNLGPLEPVGLLRTEADRMTDA